MSTFLTAGVLPTSWLEVLNEFTNSCQFTCKEIYRGVCKMFEMSAKEAERRMIEVREGCWCVYGQ